MLCVLDDQLKKLLFGLYFERSDLRFVRGKSAELYSKRLGLTLYGSGVRQIRYLWNLAPLSRCDVGDPLLAVVERMVVVCSLLLVLTSSDAPLAHRESGDDRQDEVLNGGV